MVDYNIAVDVLIEWIDVKKRQVEKFYYCLAIVSSLLDGFGWSVGLAKK